MEVHLHNPWLTYSPGFHRLREAGLSPDLLDGLDERPLTLDEVHQFCTIMFLGDDSQTQIPLPPYQPATIAETGRVSWLQAWTPFMRALKKIVDREKLQWNPVYKQMMPWINCAKLEMNLMEQLREKDEAINGKYNYYNEQSNCSSSTNNGRQRANRQTTFGGMPNPSRKPDPKAWQSARGVTSEAPAPTPVPSKISLTEVLQQWSHQPPNYRAMHSLQRLLITVPQTFPPMNTAVEPCQYFGKWKRLDRDAFDDVDGDAVKELLKRGTLICMFGLYCFWYIWGTCVCS